MESIVVTGASTGIGRATAEMMLSGGWRVFGGVRQQADAERLSRELGPGFVPLVLDVTDQEDAVRAAATVAGVLGAATLSGLVNNAGVVVSGPLLELPLAELRRQLEVNLLGQLAVTQAFAPLLGADPARTGKPGRIVMVSSTAGHRAYPFMGPYTASKFAIEGLSESLRRELMLFGIDVVVVAPGPTMTPIWKKSDVTCGAASPFAQAEARGRLLMLADARKGQRPERVARVIAAALTARRPRARYVVTSVLDRMIDLLPRRMLDREIAGRLGLVRTSRSQRSTSG